MSRSFISPPLWFRPVLRHLAVVGLLGVSAFVAQYLASGGFFFLSSFSDLAWLKAARTGVGELAGDQLLFSGLFTYVVTFVKGFVNDAFVAFKVTSFFFYLTLVSVLCYLAVGLGGNRRVGILAGLLLALHPSMVAVLRRSACPVIIGLVWTAIALCILSVDFLSKKLFSFALVAVLSVLAALSDPLAGLILVVALFLGMIIRIKNDSLRKVLAAPLAALPGGLLGIGLLFFYGSSFKVSEMSLDPVMPALTLLTAFFGGIVLYRRQKLQSLKLLASWFVASLLVPLLLNVSVLTAVGVYALPPLVVLASALVFNIDRDMINPVKAVDISDKRKKSQARAQCNPIPVATYPTAQTRKRARAQELIEVDVTKLVCAFLLVLLVLSSLVSSYGLYAQMNATYGFESERYGDVELRETLTWISTYTPTNAVVVAEEPLGEWVEAFSGRASLSKSYAAESILNANYEVRNLFLRLRDWGPMAPQRVPFFAVSDGQCFTDFLYVDESHAQVTYLMGGNLFKPNFYNYSVCFSGWISRSSDVAMLRHVFEVGGALINKTIWLSKDSAEASVEYVVEAKPNVSLQNFSLKAWIPWERRLGYTKVSGSTLELILDVGDFLIVFEGNVHSVDFGPDKQWSQQRAEAHFVPVGGQVYAKMSVKALTAKPIAWSEDEVVAYATKELMAEYRVAYVVVPTIVKKQLMDRFGLDFDTFVSVFENSKLTVYKVIA